MKNLKVAVKIGAGFALVIAIAAGLGAVQLWNMMGVQGEANRLDKEIVPQVAVANDLERSVHRTMYSMQAFLQSMDTDALDQAKQFLSDTQKYLADADALSAKYPRLVVLRKNVAEAKPSVDEYAKLVDDTIAVNASITVERMNQASSGTTFNTTVQNYILKKTADLNALISRHASTAELKSTLQELTTANEVRDLGNGLRIGNFETQATSDPSFLKDAMASFADVANRITSWRALPTVNKDDLIQLDAVSSSGNNYLQASQTVLDDVVKRSEVNAAQRKTADVVLDAALQTSLEGFKDAATITTLTVARLMTAIIVLVMGVAAATVMGIAVAIAITRTITRPLFKGVAFAQQIARGDFSTLLDIQQRDEVGALASALNEMAIKLRDVVLSVQESASQVAHSSEEISTGAQKLARADERRCRGAGRIGGRSLRARAVSGCRGGGRLELDGSGAQLPGSGHAQPGRNIRSGQEIGGKRRGGRQGGAVRRGGDQSHLGRVRENRRHRGGDLRHCGPDQSPGAQRRDRSGEGRGARARICRGGGRGEQAGRAKRILHQGDRGPDQGEREEYLRGSEDRPGIADRHGADPRGIPAGQ
jgi:HAMP domain-containing protein/CHASE3 domain sensor protein